MTALTGVHADRPVHIATRGGERVVVKRYLAGGAQAVHTQMCDLWASPFGRSRRPPGLPRPLGVDTVREEVTMQFLPGEPLGTRGDLGRSVEQLPDSARLLAHLHGSGVEVTRRRDPAALARSGRRKFDDLGRGVGSGHGPGSDRSAVRDLAGRVVAGLERTLPSTAALVVSHGDFSPQNVLATPSGPALIDFDRLQMAAPERDISHWGAWTWVTMFTSGQRPSWQVADDLALAYSRIRPVLADSGSTTWAFYRAVSLLRIAHGWSALHTEPRIAADVLGEALLLLGGGGC